MYNKRGGCELLRGKPGTTPPDDVLLFEILHTACVRAPFREGAWFLFQRRTAKGNPANLGWIAFFSDHSEWQNPHFHLKREGLTTQTDLAEYMCCGGGGR